MAIAQTQRLNKTMSNYNYKNNQIKITDDVNQSQQDESNNTSFENFSNNFSY